MKSLAIFANTSFQEPAQIAQHQNAPARETHRIPRSRFGLVYELLCCRGKSRGRKPKPENAVLARDEVHDPYLLEFLDLKDEYDEGDLEEAIIRHLESFLLEMGFGFTFVARQKRIRIGDELYRIDLLVYHRILRCLVVIEIKMGPFSHADAGQMNLYLNYAREHMTLPGEEDPVGLILCSDKNDVVVKYATGGIRTQVFASKYLTALPDEETLRREILATQRALEHHAAAKKGKS